MTVTMAVNITLTLTLTNALGALYNLGMLHLSGEVIPKNDGEALKYFKAVTAQKQLDPRNRTLLDALNQVGLLYQRSKTIFVNNEEATKHFRLAADNGHKEARSNLEIMEEINKILRG